MTSPLKSQLQQTKQKYQKSLRKKDLEQRYQTIRNKMLDLPKINQSQYQKLKQAQTAQLNQILAVLDNCPQRSEQIIETLWNDYISYKFNYFDQNHINRLIRQFTKIKDSLINLQGQNGAQRIIKMISIIVWLISNRFKRVERLNASLICLNELIQGELQLLQADKYIKLNHLILLNFTNLCKYHDIQYKLIQSGIIPMVLSCHLFEGKEQDKSILLSNLIYSLPFQFRLKSQQITLIISFIHSSQHLILHQKFIFQDCLLILNKILIINQASFYTLIIQQLQHVILYYIKSLSLHINNKLQDLLELMINIYTYKNHSKVLNNQEIYLFIWDNIDVILQGQAFKYLEEDRPLNRIIWKFLTVFCKIKHSMVIKNVLNEVYARFNEQHNKKIQDYEEIALNILIQNYERQNEVQLLPFWSKKLSQFYNIQSICLGLLKRIFAIIQTEKNVMVDDKRYEDLRQLIGSLQFNENEQIKLMAMKMIQRQRQMGQ